MDVSYTDYAEETLKEREISKENVELTLLKPVILSEGKKGRKIAHKIFGGRLLRVVFETEANAYIVITAYYTKPRRYVKR